jgi:hypothetical protein
MKRIFQEDHKSTSLNSQINQMRKTKVKKYFFDMRNVIKKVKTHGLKIFTRCLLACTSLKGIAKRGPKRVYKLFKSDICKSRNRFILDCSMRQILSTFSSIDIEVIDSSVRPEKRLSFNFLMNLTWNEYLSLLRHESREIIELIHSYASTKLTPRDVVKYYEYIYHGIDYKKRISTDSCYLELYVLINPVQTEPFSGVHDFIDSFNGKF